ncbi:MAG: cysteine synthase A [Halobacteriales archaeon]
MPGPDLTAVAVEPAESAVLSGDDPDSHDIQGIGAGFVPEILRVELIHEVETVTDDEAKHATRRLAREEGLLTGASSGAALAVAERVATDPEHGDDLVVVVLPDSGERYLSRDLFEA